MLALHTVDSVRRQRMIPACRTEGDGFARSCTCWLRIIEFIPIKSLAAMASGAPGSCAGHSTVPSPDHGRLLSTGGCGLSRYGRPCTCTLRLNTAGSLLDCHKNKKA